MDGLVVFIAAVILFIIFISVITSVQSTDSESIKDEQYVKDTETIYTPKRKFLIQDRESSFISNNPTLQELHYQYSINALVILTYAAALETVSNCDRELLLNIVINSVRDILDHPIELLDTRNNSSDCNLLINYISKFKHNYALNRPDVPKSTVSMEDYVRSYHKQMKYLALSGNYFAAEMIKAVYSNGVEAENFIHKIFKDADVTKTYWFPPATYFLIVVKSLKATLDIYEVKPSIKTCKFLLNQFEPMFDLNKAKLLITFNTYFGTSTLGLTQTNLEQ